MREISTAHHPSGLRVTSFKISSGFILFLSRQDKRPLAGPRGLAHTQTRRWQQPRLSFTLCIWWFIVRLFDVRVIWISDISGSTSTFIPIPFSFMCSAGHFCRRWTESWEVTGNKVERDQGAMRSKGSRLDWNPGSCSEDTAVQHWALTELQGTLSFGSDCIFVFCFIFGFFVSFPFSFLYFNFAISWPTGADLCLLVFQNSDQSCRVRNVCSKNLHLNLHEAQFGFRK